MILPSAKSSYSKKKKKKRRGETADGPSFGGSATNPLLLQPLATKRGRESMEKLDAHFDPFTPTPYVLSKRKKKGKRREKKRGEKPDPSSLL